MCCILNYSDEYRFKQSRSESEGIYKSFKCRYEQYQAAFIAHKPLAENKTKIESRRNYFLLTETNTVSNAYAPASTLWCFHNPKYRLLRFFVVFTEGADSTTSDLQGVISERCAETKSVPWMAYLSVSAEFDRRVQEKKPWGVALKPNLHA